MNAPRDEDIVLLGLTGSKLYNLNHAGSDDDWQGIMLNPIEDILNVDGMQNSEWKDPSRDFKYYGLYKFLHLARGCNPNIIEMLFLPKDAIIKSSPIYERLVEMRSCFISKQARHTYSGYAHAQIKRARGIEKKGNHINTYINDKGLEKLRMLLTCPFVVSPEDIISRMFGRHMVGYLCKLPPFVWTPELRSQYESTWEEELLGDSDLRRMLPPRPSDFIHWYGDDAAGMPFRALPFTTDPTTCSIAGNPDPARLDASSVEHAPGFFRLYRNGSGFLSPDGLQVICHSISIEREKDDFAGVVHVDTDGYEKAKAAYDSFFEWMANRNEERYKRDWDSEAQVDYKNLMHTMRLLLSAKSIAVTGEPLIRFEGAQRDYLMYIRSGKYSYEQILQIATDLSAEVDELFDKSDLPNSSDIKRINNFFMEVYQKGKRKWHLSTTSRLRSSFGGSWNRLISGLSSLKERFRR